jgi:TonB-dependent SusC/RagA subfamily outer membrane receptor
MKIKIVLSLFLILSCSFISTEQKKNKKFTISGIVTDGQHRPVEGAAIFIDKVKTSSVTDNRGYYSVKANHNAKEILVFTLLNGASEEVINGRTSIDFMLSGKSTESVSKKDAADNQSASDNKNISNSRGMIDGQDPKFASYQSIYDMIRGRFPGVEVSGKSIKIAGSSSLNVSTEPLFVVDGVIVNSIDDIPPLTVKSIEVLKGPDATVYGIRGSNGVIVITRLTGKDIK